MSFILDALKKLEQKRRQGSVPDLMTVHTQIPENDNKRKLWPYFFLAALLLNAVIFTAWLRPWKEKEQIASAQPASNIEHRPESAAARPERENNENGITVANVKINKTVKASDNSSLKSAPDKIKRAADKKDADATDKSPADDKTASPKINMSDEELKILRSKIKEEISSPKDYPQVNDNEAGSDNRVLEFSQLPEEIRKELPEISVSGHIYSDNPGARIVNINGRILREGEAVTKGLDVKEITMSGVIFSYQDFRFRIRAF